MQSILSILQIIVSVALVVAILFQQRGGGGSAIFGGSGGGSGYYTKRGFERIIFIATIVLAVLFILLSLINLFI